MINKHLIVKEKVVFPSEKPRKFD